MCIQKDKQNRITFTISDTLLACASLLKEQVLFPISEIPTRPSKKLRSAATIKVGRILRAESDSRSFVCQQSQKPICSRHNVLSKQMAESACSQETNPIVSGFVAATRFQ